MQPLSTGRLIGATQRGRIACGLLLGCAPFALGCLNRPVVDIRLVHSPSLSPAAFSTLTLQWRRPDGDEVIRETRLLSVALGADVDDLPELQVGARYQVELSAEANAACASRRAVGRSLAFTHRDADYRIPVHIGCADEFFGMPGPKSARVGDALLALPDGGALLAGGARAATRGAEQSLRFSALQQGGLISSIERYDPAEGRFAETSTLAVPRAEVGAVALPEGAGLVGGTLERASCSRQVELSFRAATSPGASLAEARCGARALHLSAAGAVVVVGGAPASEPGGAAPTEVEVFGEDLRTAAQRGPSDVVARHGPHLLALSDGRSALVVGGNDADAAPAVVRVDADCTGGRTGGACLSAVSGWAGLANVRHFALSAVQCGSGGRTLYLTGGRSGPEGMGRDDIFCAVENDGAVGSLASVGQLPEARYRHRSVAVRGDRLLLVGGQLADRAATDALLVQVSPCACEPVTEISRVSLPVGGTLLHHHAVRLADGAVLLLGGLAVEGDTYTPRGEAALFVPDLFAR